MRDYYVQPENAPAGFAGALNAVSKIEYQCSRSGIRALLTKVLVGSQPQFFVENGTLLAHKTEDSPKKNQDKDKKGAAVVRAVASGAANPGSGGAVGAGR